MPKPHPNFAQYATRCSQLVSVAAKPWKGVGFRYAALKYGQSKDLVSGQGAKMTGGRLNVIGSFPVVYTSADPLTATAETYQNFIVFGFAMQKVRPKVVVGLKIKLRAVLDLCDATLRRRIKVTLKDLATPWWPSQETGNEALTQALGRAAFNAGFEAIILPSVHRKQGINVNIFPENLHRESFVKVLGSDELKGHLK